MNILFLDDNPNRTKQFRQNVPYATTAETAQQMIDLLKEEDETIDILFLDHDLGNEVFVDSGREDCGMEVVRWLCQNERQISQIVVHTLNPDAGRDMVKKLSDKGYDVLRVPFILFNEQIYPQLSGNKEE